MFALGIGREIYDLQRQLTTDNKKDDINQIVVFNLFINRRLGFQSTSHYHYTMPKKEKSNKGSKNNKQSKGNKSSRGSRNQQQKSRQKNIHVAAYGDPRAVDLLLSKNGGLFCKTELYDVTVDVFGGTNLAGRITGRSPDLNIGVYDVNDWLTVEYLERVNLTLLR